MKKKLTLAVLLLAVIGGGAVYFTPLIAQASTLVPIFPRINQ